MPLFLQQRLDDPEKWRSHYEFGGALLLSALFELPGRLHLALSAAKAGAHPALAGLPEAARLALPADALLSTIRLSFDGVRGLGWIGRPGPLAELKEAAGTFGRVERFEMKRLSVAEKDLWPDAPQPFMPGASPRDLWHGVMSCQEYGLQWFCESASLREGA